MNRRRFLREGVVGSAVVLGTGGVLLFRRNHARADFAARLLDDAVPPLTDQALAQLNSLPARGRDEIRRYVHGKCLNVEGFVSHVSSDDFAERLGRCRTAEERNAAFTVAFFSRVATEPEIVNQVEVIAGELGGELDAAWSGYCAALAGRWRRAVNSAKGTAAFDDLGANLGGLIRADLSRSVELAAAAGRRVALGQTVEAIGKSAVLLLPLALIGPAAEAIAVPLFVVTACNAVWEYVADRLTDRKGDLQTTISALLAGLGNRVGAEFEREIRLRLTDLHTWQDQAVRAMANRVAAEQVGLFGVGS
jgi:hypothetical protein